MRFCRLACRVILVIGYLGTAGVRAGGDDLEALLAEGKQFAISTRSCALVDGYQCGSQIEDDFVSAAAQSGMVSGNLLKAWLVAVEDFQSQSDQTMEQTRLKHYKIGFTENSDHYVVLFQGLLLPLVDQGKVVGLSRLTLGRTTRYWISKDTFEIDKRLFYK
jgi:hypothetical protein